MAAVTIDFATTPGLVPRAGRRAARPALAVPTATRVGAQPPSRRRLPAASARRRGTRARVRGGGGPGGCGARRVLPRRPRAPPAGHRPCVVEPGDTLWSIAARRRARRRSARGRRRARRARAAPPACCRARRSPGSAGDRDRRTRRGRSTARRSDPGATVDSCAARTAGTNDDKVVDSRVADDGGAIRRRRECLACGRRFTTYERRRGSRRSWCVKRSGEIEPFDRAKLRAGIERGGDAAGSTTATVDAIVAEVEEELPGARAARSRSERVGLAVLERLRALDPSRTCGSPRSTRASRTSPTSSARSWSSRRPPRPSARRRAGSTASARASRCTNETFATPSDQDVRDPKPLTRVELQCCNAPPSRGRPWDRTTRSCGCRAMRDGLQGRSGRDRTEPAARPEGEHTTMAMAPQQLGIGIRRHFTQPGVDPYDTVEWERRDARIPNFKDGSDAFFQPDVEFPTTLVAERHEHRRPEVLPRHARHARARVVAAPGHRPRRRHDHRRGACATATSSTTHEAAAFRDELKYVLVHQRAAFNSPVWFNIGVKGVPQQASACFILAVDDTMDGDPQLVPGRGHHLQGRFRRRHQPVAASARRRSTCKGGGTASRPGELHARRRRVGRHDQVGRQDPARRQDGHPQRRPPRHRRVRLVQGGRGAQGACAARRRLRHGPRRQATATRSSTRTRTTRCASPTSSCRRSSTTATGTCKAVTDRRAGQDDARRAT